MTERIYLRGPREALERCNIPLSQLLADFYAFEEKDGPVAIWYATGERVRYTPTRQGAPSFEVRHADLEDPGFRDAWRQAEPGEVQRTHYIEPEVPKMAHGDSD